LFPFEKKKTVISHRNGNFKLDGGAMFLWCQNHWNKTNPADENNLIDIARCLLIRGNRLILIDTGMGKTIGKIFGYYSLWGTHSWINRWLNMVFIAMIPMFL
jgi:hypothetical protein